MISVIESSNNIKPFDYSGYSILEAGFEAMNAVEEMFNDLTTGILLNEFQYYVENGTEIVYEEDTSLVAPKAKKEDDAAEEKSAGGLKGIAEKFANIIKTWAAKLLGILQKAADYIVTQAQSLSYRATAVKTKVGISKADIEAMLSVPQDKYNEIVAKVVGSNFIGIDIASADIGQNWALAIDWNNPPTEVKTPREEYDDKFKGSALNVEYYAKSKVKQTVQGAYKFIGKKILSAKRSVEKVANEEIRRIKSTKADDMKEKIQNCKTAMKIISARISALVLVYKTYASQCRGIVKACSTKKEEKPAEVANNKEGKEDKGEKKEKKKFEVKNPFKKNK